jgi:6-phosphogluconolactonase
MKVFTLPDAEQASRAAAAAIAEQGRRALAERQQFTLALSGGTSPLRMFEVLSAEDLDWQRVHLFQVDERLVAADSPERNFNAIRERLLAHITIPPGQLYPMPLELADPDAAASNYAGTLRRVLGPHGAFDLVHLGLGADGHTASLLPGDPALESTAAVIVSRNYHGARRLSLSLPVISAARQRLWLVTGTGKDRALQGLLDGDTTLPAARVNRQDSLLYCGPVYIASESR